MKALLIVLAVLVLLALIPLGAHVRYDSEGAFVWLTVGPIRIRLLPKKPKKAQKDKKEKKKKEKKPKEPEEPGEKKEKQPLGGLIRDFMPFVRLGIDLLGCFFCKLRIPILTLHVGFGGADDPAGAAVNYGRCSCDFTRGDMRVFAETKAVFLLGDLVAMAVRYGLRALRLYLRMKKQRKISQEKAVQ